MILDHIQYPSLAFVMLPASGVHTNQTLQYCRTRKPNKVYREHFTRVRLSEARHISRVYFCVLIATSPPISLHLDSWRAVPKTRELMCCRFSSGMKKVERGVNMILIRGFVTWKHSVVIRCRDTLTSLDRRAPVSLKCSA